MKAKFNGLEFTVLETSLSGGERTSIHEFPGENQPYVQNLGNSAETIEITAIFFGVSAINQAIEFKNTLKSNPRGVLFHPQIGDLLVVMKDHRQSINNINNSATINLTFIQTSATPPAGFDHTLAINNQINQINQKINENAIESLGLLSGAPFTNNLNEINTLNSEIQNLFRQQPTKQLAEFEFNQSVLNKLLTFTTPTQNLARFINLSSKNFAIFNKNTRSFIATPAFNSQSTTPANLMIQSKTAIANLIQALKMLYLIQTWQDLENLIQFISSSDEMILDIELAREYRQVKSLAIE